MHGREEALTLLAGPQPSGPAFLDAAAHALTMGLGWRWAGVGRLSGQGRAIELLALRDREERCRLFSYDLEGTPCRNAYVANHTDPHVFIPDRVCEHFPKDQILIDLGAASYCGEAFYDESGRAVGHVFAISDTAKNDDPESRVFFRLISQRIGAEFNRWQAEQALRKNEERFRSLFEQASDGIFIIDPSTYHLLDVNENACKLTGYRRDELLRMTVHDTYPPDERATTATLGADVKSGKSVVLERNRQRKDGTRMPVEISMRLVTYGDERVILSIFRDATDRRRAEEALRTSEAQLRQIIDLVPHQIYVKDREGRFLLVNKTKAEAFGTTVEDLTGAIELERHHDPVAARRYHEIDLEVITSARPGLMPEDRTVDAKGMDHVYQTLKVPYHVGDDGAAVLGVSVDITEQKKAQAKVRQHEAELAHVLRMGTMWEMASGLSHQINQPLTAIANYAAATLQNLGAGKWSQEDIIEALEQTYHEADRASDVVRHINRFIRKAEPRPELTDANEVVRSVLGLARSELAKGQVKLDLHLQKSGSPVWVDRIQIEQALLNLIRNAVEAMRVVPKRDRRISIWTSVIDPNDVAITVRDHGPGVAGEDLKRIFDPFFSTKPSGMGMGLSITRTIVEAHGGRVEILGDDVKGATFRVVLPAENNVTPDDG